jgi:glycerophosphoryl diester phosphodiesterase
MRTIFLTVALAALTGAPAAAAAPNVLNVAHRGASGHAPEHTFAAYDLALKMGADLIEQDLQMTSDGALVVLHDSTLDRTTDCTGAVNAKTLAEVKRCDAGSWFGPQFAGARVPTLDEVFRRYGRKVNYYIETKSPEQAPGMEEALLALLDKHRLRRRAQRHWQVLIQSFSPLSLQRIHGLDPALPLIQLTTAGALLTVPLASTYAVGLGPSSADVTRQLVELAHERCLAVHPYTVNDSEDLRALVEMGVDGAFSNFPDRFDAVLGPRAQAAAQAIRAAAREHRECLTTSP